MRKISATKCVFNSKPWIDLFLVNFKGSSPILLRGLKRNIS